MAEQYTPGHTQNAVDFMSRRTIESHGAFLLPYLRAGLSVLDCGCGPGSLTCGIARRMENGWVVGIDASESQIQTAASNALASGLGNVAF